MSKVDQNLINNVDRVIYCEDATLAINEVSLSKDTVYVGTDLEKFKAKDGILVTYSNVSGAHKSGVLGEKGEGSFIEQLCHVVIGNKDSIEIN